MGEARTALWWATGICCVVGAALAGPEWLPLSWTREDGPVEWIGFASFLTASALAFVAAWRLRPVLRPAVAAAVLGAVLLFAAGEEISWGQRVFGVDTPEVLVDGNRQDELNLHNLAALQDKAIVAQLAVAGGGVLLALRVPRPWARVGAPFFAGYLMYRGARGVAAIADWGPAGRNSEAAEVLLGFGLLALTAVLVAEVRDQRPSETQRSRSTDQSLPLGLHGGQRDPAVTDERVGAPSSPPVTPAIGVIVTDENLIAQRRIDAPPRTVFALLADPANHAAIDGTGWVRGPLKEGVQITAEGEVFDMAMYHPQHPDGDYEIANRVVAFEPPAVIEWEPGYYVEDGQRDSGAWTWRYDLVEVDGQTDVTLTYDWSNATPEARERFQFPPFGVDKLSESLDNLATLTT